MRISLKKTAAYVGAVLLLSGFVYAAFNRDDRERILSTYISEHFPLPQGSEAAYAQFIATFADAVPAISMPGLKAMNIGDAGYAEAVLSHERQILENHASAQAVLQGIQQLARYEAIGETTVGFDDPVADFQTIRSALDAAVYFTQLHYFKSGEVRGYDDLLHNEKVFSALASHSRSLLTAAISAVCLKAVYATMELVAAALPPGEVERTLRQLDGSPQLAPALFHTLKGEYCMSANTLLEHVRLQGPVYRFFYLENQTLNALARYYLQYRKFIDEEVPEDLSSLQPVSQHSMGGFHLFNPIGHWFLARSQVNATPLFKTALQADHSRASVVQAMAALRNARLHSSEID